jgi:hypothetical protein
MTHGEATQQGLDSRPWLQVLRGALPIAAVAIVVVWWPLAPWRLESLARDRLAADAAEAEPMIRYHRLVDGYSVPGFLAPGWVWKVSDQRLLLSASALDEALRAGSPEAFSVVYTSRYNHPELQDKYPRDRDRRATVLRRLSYAWPNIGTMDASRRISLVWDAERCHLYEGPEPSPETVVVCVEHASRIPNGLEDAIVGAPILR